MSYVQFNNHFCFYQADEEIVLYSKADKKTYLLTNDQSFILAVFLKAKESVDTLSLNDWFDLSQVDVKIGKQLFDHVVDKLSELGIINIVKSE